jgi:subtilisin family serine protease
MTGNKSGFRRTAGTVFYGVLALSGLSFHAQAQGPAQGQGRGPVKIPGQYIVVMRDEISGTTQAGQEVQAAQTARSAWAIGQKHGLRPGHVYSAAFKGFAATIPDARLRAVASDPRVKYIEQDQMVYAFSQTLPPGVARIDADLSSTRSGNGSGSVNIDIAVIDTGIQANHPDLNVVGGINYTSDSRSSWGDGNGHGTHVAGIAAARDNGSGVVGVAPGARLWAVRVLDSQGSGTMSGVIAGVDWVTANAGTIEVANMSLGGGTSAALNDALSRSVAKGVFYAVAAGNESVDAKNTSPANCTTAGVCTVSAMYDANGVGGGGSTTSFGKDDSFATFSNRGSRVDIAAPGVNILSTYKGSTYARMSGTSMSSPHVAGAAALYIAKYTATNGKRPSAADVESKLKANGVPQKQAWSVDTTGRKRGGFTGDTDGYAEPLVDAGGY